MITIAPNMKICVLINLSLYWSIIIFFSPFSIPISITPGIKKFYKQDITVCINIVSIKQDMIDCLLFFHVYCLFTKVSTTSSAAKALEVEHFGFCSHHLVLAGVFIIVYLISVIFLKFFLLTSKIQMIIQFTCKFI